MQREIFLRQYVVIGLLCAVLSLCSLFLAIHIGAFPLPQEQIWQVVLHIFDKRQIDETLLLVVQDIRLSRAILSWFIGAGLGISGVVFQGVLRNPLADPFTLGIASGGAVGASLALSFGLPSLLLGSLSLPLCALIGSFLALGCVLLLGRVNGKLQRESLVLAGIVVATFFSAFISLVKALNEESVSAIIFWIMGSLQGRGWEHVQLYLPFFLLGTALVAWQSKELDMLALGEEQASGLGVNVSRSRIVLLTAASFITAGAVSVCGVIGFIGLIVPHVLRMVQGEKHRPLLINSALLGATLLLCSDILARSILEHGAELPVGVITALLGGPFFCFILYTRQRNIR